MSFSLTDPTLSPDEPEKPRRSNATASHTESGLKEAGTLTLPINGVETAFSSDEFTEIRALFDEVSHEWAEMVNAIQDLKQALGPEDFMAVLRSARLEAAGIKHLRPEDPVLDSSDESDEAHQDEGVEVEEVAKVEAKVQVEEVEVEVVDEEAELYVEEEIEADVAEQEQEQEEERGGEEEEEAGAINAKLNQLLKLLKEGMAAKAAEDGPQPVQLSRSVTHEIAREVAGRVKESVLSSVRHKVEDIESGAVKKSPAASQKRIPLDDIGAIIDQITGQDG